MFSLMMEKEPSVEEVEEEANEEEEDQPPDEQTVFFNQEISECFALFDKQKTGTFETKFLERALRCLGIFLTSYEMDDVRDALNSEGFVKFEQFQEYTFQKLSECDAGEALKIAFRTFDPDNEGILSTDRVKRWLTNLGDPLTDKEVKELIKMGDPAGKGIIAYNDLAMILIQ